MSYREICGNIFSSKAQALVNTVNCVGAMGKGIALEFRRRFPQMFLEYQKLCKQRRLRPGQFWLYQETTPWVLNFAIKDDWHHPARIEWIEQSLESFARQYRELGIKSVAFPWMGAMNGQIPMDVIQSTMRRHLQDLTDCGIEVYTFDPLAPDPLFEELQRRVDQLPPREFTRRSGMASRAVKSIYEALNVEHVPSLALLLEIRAIGSTSADKLYAYLLARDLSGYMTQGSLFTAED